MFVRVEAANPRCYLVYGEDKHKDRVQFDAVEFDPLCLGDEDYHDAVVFKRHFLVKLLEITDEAIVFTLADPHARHLLAFALKCYQDFRIG